MLYELRHYDLRDSRAMEQINRRFADHTLDIWQRIGITPVGFWTVSIGQPSPRLTYMLSWEDLGQRQTLWDAFEADPEWREVRDESNAALGGSPIHTLTSTILKPTDFSRLPGWHDQPARLQGGIFELRTYRFDEAAKLAQAVEWFGENAAFREGHGMYAMGYWTTYLGVSPRLTYMLIFENLSHRERSWANLYTDPEWPSRQDGLYPGGRALMTGIESCVMKGTDFSGWK